MPEIIGSTEPCICCFFLDLPTVQCQCGRQRNDSRSGRTEQDFLLMLFRMVCSLKLFTLMSGNFHLIFLDCPFYG